MLILTFVVLPSVRRNDDMSDSKHEKGWGVRAKEERTRQRTNEKLKAQAPDVNDEFKFKPVKAPRATSKDSAPATTPATATTGNTASASASTTAPAMTAAQSDSKV